jgi:alpha-D-ribose 1-methylphosphonate 5-triphosphate synthase subunit PhnI
MIIIDIQKLESNAKEKSSEGEKQMKDLINEPPHYNVGDINCLQLIKQQLGKEGYLAYLTGSAYKYLYRHEHKEENIADLKKCKYFIEAKIEELENL